MFDFVCTNVLSFGSRLIPVTGQAGAGQSSIYEYIETHNAVILVGRKREKRGGEKEKKNQEEGEMSM